MVNGLLKVEVVCLIVDPTHSKHFACFFSTNFWAFSFRNGLF